MILIFPILSDDIKHCLSLSPTLSDSSFSTSFLILRSMKGFRIMWSLESWSAEHNTQHTRNPSAGTLLRPHRQVPRERNKDGGAVHSDIHKGISDAQFLPLFPRTQEKYEHFDVW